MLASPTPRAISVVYRRLPNDIREFPGVLRQSSKGKLIIESPIMTERPISVSDEIIADTGYTAIWFVYVDKWFDVAKFFDKTRRWIGYYCDIIKPVKRLLVEPSRTVTLTDLFLDLWIDRTRRISVLDEDELKQAQAHNRISTHLALEATRRMRLLACRARTGQFPPLEVRKIRLLSKSG